MQKAFEKIAERLREESTQWNKVRSIYERTGECDNYTDGRVEAFGEAITIVNQVAEEYSHRNSDLVIEASHRNDGWIPCERELPEIHEDTKSSDVVLVAGYDKNANFDWQAMGFYVKADGISRWFFADCRNTDKPIDWIDIVAWQPLPQPYVKGE
jgi:hypothetical protein